MIPKPARHPMFYYGYRPLSDTCRYFPDDGGFSVSLYHDGQLVFDMLRQDGSMYSQYVYQLPAELCSRLLEYADHEATWLSAVPSHLQLPYDRAPRFESRVGVAGYPLVICDDIPQMIRMSFMDGMGRAARKLCCMMEDIAELMAPYGISLYLNGYGCDDNRIKPVETHTAEEAAWAQVANF